MHKLNKYNLLYQTRLLLYFYNVLYKDLLILQAELQTLKELEGLLTQLYLPKSTNDERFQISKFLVPSLPLLPSLPPSPLSMFPWALVHSLYIVGVCVM